MKKYIFLIIASSFLIGCSPSISVISDNNPSDTKLEWGLKKNEGTAPDINPGENTVLKKYSGIYMGNTEKNFIYLTFDEGYENGYTSKILDTLKEKKVPACFFVTGPYIEKEPALVKRMVNEGHIVGNHTVNHPSLPSCTNEEIENEITSLERSFYDLTGKSMKFFRPPMGEHSERTMKVTKDLGYTTVFWSLAYADWDINRQPGRNYVHEAVTKYIHNGAIILMHAVSADNAAELPAIIDDVRKMGYEFHSLDKLK